MSDIATVVHMVRHGEVHNPRGMIYGRLPGYRLSGDGVVMAKAVADALADRDVVALFSSPLDRAVQTAAPLAEAFGLHVRVDDRLIEPANHFEGHTFGVGDGALHRPSHWKYLVNPFRPSWGEPYVQIAARVLAAMADARDAARGHEAICVSHQLPIWVARRAVEGRPLWHRPDRRLCGLASLTSFTYAGDRVVAVRYAEPAGQASRRDVVSGALAPRRRPWRRGTIAVRCRAHPVRGEGSIPPAPETVDSRRTSARERGHGQIGVRRARSTAAPIARVPAQAGQGAQA